MATRPVSRPARAALAACAAALAALAPPAAGQIEHDGRYAGQVECDVFPGQTVQSLKTEFSLVVANGRAVYRREVLRPTGTARLGVTEQGTGIVLASGEVSLRGGAAGETWSYEASYQGRFDSTGVRLSGAQLWSLPNRDPYSRSCRIALSRRE